MFDKWKSSVISLFNGAVDASAIVLLFFKLVYNAGIPLLSINIFYLLSAIILILVFTSILPPYTITPERLQPINGSRDSRASHESFAKPQIADVSAFTIEGSHSNGIMHMNGTSEVNGEVGISKKNSKLQQNETESHLQSSAPSQSQAVNENNEVAKIEAESSEDSAPRLISQMLTAEYILLVLFTSVCGLRLWFYVGNLNSYLEFMSDNDMDTVDHYTNWFGIIQFSGFLFAPIVGYVMDWKPKKNQNEKTDIGFIFGFLLTSCVTLVLNILVLVPSLSVQYATFVVQVVLRAFVFSVYSAFILHKFPLVHFGKLLGAGHIISSAIVSIQYGLVVVTEDTLKKDPFWVNVSLLVLCLFLNILPAYLWIKEKRQNGQNRRIEVNRSVI